MTTTMRVPHRPEDQVPDAWAPAQRASQPTLVLLPTDDRPNGPDRVTRGEPTGHAERTQAPVLEVIGVSARATDGTRILDDISFSVERGWLVAVVGPTGAGKTSLMRTLTGRLALEAGEIRLEGQDLSSPGGPVLRRRVGYVPQEDLLHPQLGLRRTLEYAASLRLPPSTSPVQRSGRVRAVLAELDLERQAKLRVASLSGGQRKRANLALELLAHPDVLVLDEPTTGLDPAHERSVMTMLRQVADRGRTVLAVTHSMQTLELCDRVLFMATGGQMAFFGTPAEAIAYFELSDAADLFSALDRQAGKSWKDRWLAHATQAYLTPGAVRVAQVPRCWEEGLLPAPGSVAQAPALAPPGFWSQVSILVCRYLDLIRSDRRHVTMLVLQGPVLGLLLLAVLAPGGLVPMAPVSLMSGNLLGLVDPHAVSVAVFLAISVTWLGTSSAVREIVKEHPILQREKGAGLSLAAYVTSKMSVLGLLIVGEAVVFTALALVRQSPPSHGAVLWWGAGELMVTTALIGVAAVALGLLLSALVSTPDKAMTVLPIALVAQLVLSGAWGAVTQVPGIPQLSYLTGAHWGVKAVEATVTGDAGAWWTSIAMLVLLTVVTLAGTALLIRRRLAPAGAAGTHRLQDPEQGGASSPTRSAVLVPLVSAYLLFGLATTMAGNLKAPRTVRAGPKVGPKPGRAHRPPGRS